jgi:hypothetical protein
MHLLYADETSLDPNKHEFFVYGGVAIPCDSAAELHNGFEEMRKHFKIPSPFLLKFNPGPEHLKHEEFVEVKKAVFEIAAKSKCTFLTTISHHKIIRSVDEARRGEINRIAFHFNALMNQRKDHGLILIDRFTDKQIDEHLREKFSVGLTGMPYSDQIRLAKIVGLHYSAIGQSHFPSLIDILMGSLRFAIDAFSSQKDQPLKTASSILKEIAPLFDRTSKGLVSELSIHFTPQVVKVKSYRERYNALREFFKACGVEPQQEVAEYRMY